MALSAPNVATETCMTEAQLRRALRSWYSSNAKIAPIRENALNDPYYNARQVALHWLGDRYLCARPQRRLPVHRR